MNQAKMRTPRVIRHFLPSSDEEGPGEVLKTRSFLSMNTNSV